LGRIAAVLLAAAAVGTSPSLQSEFCFGGEAGQPNRIEIEQGGKLFVHVHLSKDQDIGLRAGNTINVQTPGGGGLVDRVKDQIGSRPAIKNMDMALFNPRIGLSRVYLLPNSKTYDSVSIIQLVSTRSGLGRRLIKRRSA
jgi:hypothetical protein